MLLRPVGTVAPTTLNDPAWPSLHGAPRPRRNAPNCRRLRVTPMQYYAHRLHWRRGELHAGGQRVLMSGRLFQEYVCTAWARTEAERLLWQRNNQATIRVDTYANLHLAYAGAQAAGETMPSCGRTVVLSRSFMGGPRDTANRFHDAMAVIRATRRPSLFITMTCNPRWPEIQQCLPYNSKPEDHPELVARVFKMKLDELLEDIEKRHVLGKIDAIMSVVEFQYRGLPHAHILVVLCSADAALSADRIDDIVCTELPPESQPRLRNLVLEHMVHNDCEASRDCMCRRRSDGRECRWHFPKDYCDVTSWTESNLFPRTRRRRGDSASWNGRVVTNQWIAGYNAYLLDRYECHLNVEVVASLDSVKYLCALRAGPSPAAPSPAAGLPRTCPELPHPMTHQPLAELTRATSSSLLADKYLYKGPDRAGLRGRTRDEVSDYMVMRYFGAAESCWRLFHYPLYYSKPSVQLLQMHLQDEQRIAFRAGSEARHAQAPPNSALLEWLNFCRAPVSSARLPLPPGWRDLTYITFPGYFSYKDQRGWQPRPRAGLRFRPVGRLPVVNVQAQEELFYLRVLLCHITAGQVQDILSGLGAYDTPSVDHLKGGHTTFKEACQARGLANDDNEWRLAIDEAVQCETMRGKVLDLLGYILIWNSPSDPHGLFERAWDSIACSESAAESDDAMVRATQRHSVSFSAVRRVSAWHAVLTDLLAGGLPELEARSKLPPLTEAETGVLAILVAPADRRRRLVDDEYRYNPEREGEQFQAMYAQMTDEQRRFVDDFVHALDHGETFVAFLSAYAGCGKTFVERALCHSVRSRGRSVLACAATGIAALLLDGGTTLHSRLKVPLTVSADDPSATRLGINMNSMEAELVRDASVLLLDEVVMFRWALIEAVDRSFREIRGDNRPFGGVIVVMGGDFRQTLPIEQNAQRAQIVDMCVSRWPAWGRPNNGVDVRTYSLTTNLRAERLARGAASAAEQSRIRRWATWLERLGDGELGGAQDEVGHADLSEWFDDICHRVDDVAGVQAMLRSVYDCRDEDLASQPTEFWSNRAIVTPRHVSVDYLNDLMLQRVPGDEITLNSADVVDLDDRGLVEITSDFLNAQNPPGMPPHVLKLKLNAVVILLRNLDRKRGLVNGTRLQVREVVGNRLLRCDILSGECRGRTCVIPRIKLKPPKSRLHVSWYRVQFPVKLAYAMSKLRRSRRPPASALPPTRCSFAHSATPAP
jgi:hypothetical protein